MTGPASRRGFLRSLAGLPLLGGGIALVGNPTAAAEPVSHALLRTYVGWLAHEHRAAYAELQEMNAIRHVADLHARGVRYRDEYVAVARQDARARPAMYWFPEDGQTKALVEGADLSSRAAVVLGAAGVDWRVR